MRIEKQGHTNKNDKATNKPFAPINGSPVRLLKSKKIAENRFTEVYMDELEFADGHQGTHLRVHEPGGGVVVLVQNEKDEFYLHEAYHYSINEFCLEIIRGWGLEGEHAEAAALREMDEEAGFRYSVVGKPKQLGVVYPNSTLLMNRVPVYLVRVTGTRAAKPKEAVEALRRGGWYSLATIDSRVAAGKIHDGFTLSAIALYKAAH